MKICFVHEEYPLETNFGGIATYQKIMASYYASQGDLVTVIARGNEDACYYEDGVKVYRIKSLNDSNDITSIKEFRKKVALLLVKLQTSNEIEIIETPDWGATTVYFEKYRKVPLIIRLHTPLKIWLLYNNNNFGIATKLLLNSESFMLSKADTITSCSTLLRDMVNFQYNLKRRISVIPNPYNAKDFYLDNNYSVNKNIIYIGSLEERKGVIIFAKALNIILKEIKDNKVYIVGKDTKRNTLNTSTKELMLSIINKCFHNRIIFVGQVDNKRINYYLNNSFLAVFPSLFDNFPYVILEAMTTGKYVVCSDNIGIKDICSKNKYLFATGNYLDLANKVINVFKTTNSFFNYDNIKLVNKFCNSKLVCSNIKDIYQKTINDYKEKEEIKGVLKLEFKQIKIVDIEKYPKNLANIIYIVTTATDKYVVKKYNYQYDFNLSNMLYDIYEKNNITVVRPINKELINFNNNNYNIFKYINNQKYNVNQINLFKLLTIERKVNAEESLLNKCQKYYNYLINIDDNIRKIYNNEKLILQQYEKISRNKLFKEKYLNHGDLSFNNILYNNSFYIIDFDEAVVTTKLYDFAVIVIKFYTFNGEFKKTRINNLINKLMKTYDYKFSDYILAIRFYLCKILLEKFYLYEADKIDLYSADQLNDDYRKYLKLLKNVNSLEEKQ